ncbi:MAG: tRNA uridine-5-carboxymethylaminomethyl(34) synthesis GTPase MnmE, partial [Shinella sp.]
LYDTAGLRETDDVVEREGIRRTHVSMSQAHLILLLSEEPGADWPVLNETYGGPVIRVGTKADKVDPSWPQGGADVMISVKSGDGIPDLLSAIGRYLPDLETGSALALPTRQRHVANLAEARKQIQFALASGAEGLDIRAEYLRLAGHALGRVTGRVDVENLLDVIFSEFCIGK